MNHRIEKIAYFLKRVLALPFALLVIFFYISSGGYHIGWNLVTGDPLTNTEEQYCYSFQYPGRWRLYRSGNDGWHGGARPYQRAMVLEPKPYILGRIYFTIDQIPMEQPDLENVAAKSLAIRGDSNQQIKGSSLEQIVVDDKPALTRTFPATTPETTEIYIAREYDGLILRINTNPSYHEKAMITFQEIIDSFRYEEECAGLQPE